MSDLLSNLPETCAAALKAVEADPSNLTDQVLAHLQDCPACAEARVLWLAQEEPPQVLAPAGYFERLPTRILGKLPAGRRPALHRTRWLAVAAALMALTAGGSFWAGRINREPLVEAKLAPESKDLQPELPFHDRYEVIEQFQSLSPEEAQVLLKQLEKQEPRTNP
jgi:hypothetical protein